MFANDQSQLDAAETVTFLSRRNSVDVSLLIDSAVAYGVSQREQFASGGRYQAGDLIFTLPADVLVEAGIFPKPADQILRADGCVAATCTALAASTIAGTATAVARSATTTRPRESRARADGYKLGDCG